MNPHFVRGAIESAAATFAAGRLIFLGLTKRFPALLGFLILLALAEGVLALIATDAPIYFWSYIAYIPLQILLSIVAVRELFALVFDDYPGIRTVGRWAMYAGIILSVAASLAITRIFWRGGAGGRDSRLFYLEVGQRSVVFCLALVIATILFVLSRYPLRLSRNTYFSSLLFSLLFLSDAARLLLDSLTPGLYNRYVDGAESAVITALLTVWAGLLGPEPSPKISRIHFSVLGEKRLMEQLDSLNKVLSRAGRR